MKKIKPELSVEALAALRESMWDEEETRKNILRKTDDILYGDWKNTHRRFCRLRDKGVWEKLFKMFVQDPDFEWLMIDASYIKVHPDGTGGRGGNQDMGRTKGGSIRRYTLL